MTTTGKVQRRILRLQEEERARQRSRSRENPAEHALPLRNRIRVLACGCLRALSWPPGAPAAGRLWLWPAGCHCTGGPVAAWAAVALHAWELEPAPPVCARGPPAHLSGAKLRAQYPQLTDRDVELVLHGLRQFFSWRMCAAVISLWPCRLRWWTRHGTPSFCTRAATKTGATPRSASCCTTRQPRCWGTTPSATMACAAPGTGPARKKASTPANPPVLPLLFALDKKLGIAGGFSYVPDCHDINRQSGSDAYCGTSFGSWRLQRVWWLRVVQQQ
jgi:hypothetical protein